MDLLEYQGKQLFARHGVPVPQGKPATTVDEAVAAANEIGYPCVVKAQVLIGGRGKAGGIKVAKDEGEAREHATAASRRSTPRSRSTATRCSATRTTRTSATRAPRTRRSRWPTSAG